MFVLFAELLLILGLAVFGARIMRKLLARSRARAAARMMARTLGTRVKRENAYSAVAALRDRRHDASELPETETTHAELLQRIEKIRVRGTELAAAAPAVRQDVSKKQLQGRAADASDRGAGQEPAAQTPLVGVGGHPAQQFA